MEDTTITDLPLATGVDGAADFLAIDRATPSETERINRNTFLGVTGQPADLTTVQTVQNKVVDNTNTVTVKDTLFTLQDNTDTTKQAKFELSGITTATTRTLTLPNANVTLASLTGTETLTNKTLTSPTINTPTIATPTFSTSGVGLSAPVLTSPVMQGTVDGWISSNDTWVYASATTITIPSGGANKYAVGDKVKFTQTTVKYFYIVAVADTLLTIAPTSDYTLANAVISSNYYSHADSPVGFPQWLGYTPTWTNLSVGNGTLVAAYDMRGKTVFVRLSLTFGTTTSISGAVRLTPPVAYNTAYVLRSPLGMLHIEDNGIAGYLGAVRTNDTADGKLQLGVYGAAGTYVNGEADLSSTVPMTWGNLDYLTFNCTYEAS